MTFMLEVQLPQDTIIIDEHVCLTRELEAGNGVPAHSVRIEPGVSSCMEVEEKPAAATEMIEKKVETQLEMAGKVLRAQAQKTLQQEAKEVGQQMGTVNGKMEEMEKRMAKFEQSVGRVEEIARNCAKTTEMVEALQRRQDDVESLIERKVAAAAEVTAAKLTETMATRFDSLGQQLTSQLATVPRKRDGPEDDGVSKAQRGLGSGAGQKTKRCRIAHHVPVQQEEGEAADTDLDTEEHEDCMSEIKLRSWPKGRRDWRLWREGKSDVRQSYWEYARRSKRGNGRFSNVDEWEQPLPLDALISTLDIDKTYYIVSDEWTGEALTRLQGHREAEPSEAPLALPEQAAQGDDQHADEEVRSGLLALELRVEHLEQQLGSFVLRGDQTELV